MSLCIPEGAPPFSVADSRRAGIRRGHPTRFECSPRYPPTGDATAGHRKMPSPPEMGVTRHRKALILLARYMLAAELLGWPSSTVAQTPGYRKPWLPWPGCTRPTCRGFPCRWERASSALADRSRGRGSGVNSGKGSGGYLAFTPLDGTLPSIQSQLSRSVHRNVQSARHRIDNESCAISRDWSGTQRPLDAVALDSVP